MSEGSKRSAEQRVQLARAWRRLGREKTAVKLLEEALELGAESALVHLELGDLFLETGRVPEALDQYDRSLGHNPHQTKLRSRRAYLAALLSGTIRSRSATPQLEDRAAGRLRLNGQEQLPHQRSGWAVAIGALEPLHKSTGVLFDGFIENNFAWKHWRPDIRDAQILKRLSARGLLEELATSEERGIVPYLEPWVGFLHNPPRMPAWFHPQDSPQTIFDKPIWKESLRHCAGLFTLSCYQAEWLRTQLDVPIAPLRHPTRFDVLQFDLDSFLANPARKIVQVGWWLRKLSSIYQLPIPEENTMGYRKVRLVPRVSTDADLHQRALMEIERSQENLEIDEKFGENTLEVQHLPNPEYDRLLAENIVFLELYEAGANCALLECIARATPMLINPLPAVVEYLGKDYPLYFDSLDEAACKALDTSLLKAAHLYLKAPSIRARLTSDHFRHCFERSEIYRSL